MRKYIRKILRAESKANKSKESRFVRDFFNNLQIKKYGFHTREVNMAKGTHKKKLWPSRIAMAVSK